MQMLKKRSRFHIGMRTIKTVVSVIIAMTIVDSNVSPYSNLSVAMLGAIAAVQPSFRESLESSLSQLVGSAFGLMVGILLLQLPMDHIITTATAVVLVIVVYNSLRITYPPSLPCLMVVILCTSSDLGPVVPWALGRLWDTFIGVGVGMVVNTLLFPYDNSRQIRFTVESLDRELLVFLEDMFDGDNVMPDPEIMRKKVEGMERQLDIFSKQKLVGRLVRQRKEIEKFRVCEQKARELVARIELLSVMGRPGRLSEENRSQLILCGAKIRDERTMDSVIDERDVVVNYHVKQILKLRRELLAALTEEKKIAEQ